MSQWKAKINNFTIEKKLLVMKIHVPILNKMKSTSLEVYNWHQFVIIIICSDNVCPYLVLVHVFSSLEVYFFTANLNKEWMTSHWDNQYSATPN